MFQPSLLSFFVLDTTTTFSQRLANYNKHVSAQGDELHQAIPFKFSYRDSLQTHALSFFTVKSVTESEI